MESKLQGYLSLQARPQARPLSYIPQPDLAFKESRDRAPPIAGHVRRAPDERSIVCKSLSQGIQQQCLELAISPTAKLLRDVLQPQA